MGLLDEALAYIDNKKRVVGRNVQGLLNAPADTLSQWQAQTKEDIAPTTQALQAWKPGDPQSTQAAVQAMAPLGLLGMTAYHASPHLFDKFDMSKIGTGEGAQFFGDGLYYAEAKDVGTEYFKRFQEKHGKAYLYKVDIPDEHVAKMLDWDKALSEQPQVVKALHKVADRFPGMSDALQPFELGSTTGETINRYMSRSANPQAAREALMDAGIPGIRYLDGVSRGKGGTSNLVVFDDAIPKIVGRE